MATVAVRPFEHHVLDFLGYLEFERGLSRNTLEAYRSDLFQLGTYLEREGVDALDAEHEHLAGFLTDLANGSEDRPAVAPATLQRKAACLRSFYRHLRRKSRGLQQVLSGEEVQRLLAIPRGTDPAALRDRALLETMYACGLRASEATGLEVGDVDLEAGILRARGKGSKERLVPGGPAAPTPPTAHP